MRPGRSIGRIALYPTRAAVLAAAAGAPVALVVAGLNPAHWYAALAWPGAVLMLVVVDALGGTGTGTATLVAPPSACVGEQMAMRVAVVLAGKGNTLPRVAEVAIGHDPRLSIENDGRLWVGLDGGRGAAIWPATAIRRGTARIDRLWLRWRGALGLVWKQRVFAIDAHCSILPDIRPVREHGARIFQRHAIQGLMAQVDRGDGTDFDTLVEYRSGMDRRAIDWKQSARHQSLHAREYRSERNNQIVFALDCGRQMSEPLAGLPRIDRAVSAMLLTAWIALKLGDRVAIHAFDARPRIASGLVSGTAAFAALQRMAARIDYSGEETNHTFALTTLGQRLTRRSMIVLFTEFTDPISADFMVRAVARLTAKHLLLVVVLRDEELERMIDTPPHSADDVTRAVTAAGLLKDRLIVLTQLRHLGVHVIESEYDRVGDRLVEGYIDFKRRNLL